MTTTPVRCPECGEWLRVAVQVRLINWSDETPRKQQLYVAFDDQHVAHMCKNKET